MEVCMNYSSFCDYLLAALSSQLDADARITKEMIRKNNNVMLEAFIVRLPVSVSSPVIYLEPLYQSYKNGSSIEKIAQLIAARLKAELPFSLEMAACAHSLDTMRDKIALRLVSQKNNEALLHDVPWVPFLDLAVIFFLYLGTRDDKQITSVIHNHLAKSWNLSPDDLYEIAKINTPRIYPSTIRRLEDILLGWDEDDHCLTPCDNSLPTLFVLSNQTGINGAACMLYENTIKNFAERIGSDFIILPSSIHEVLLLADDHTHDYEMFRDMVRCINMEDVPKEDVLSGEIYLYRRGECSEIIRWMPCGSDNTEPFGTESL